jgi:hypothetical protein
MQPFFCTILSSRLIQDITMGGLIHGARNKIFRQGTELYMVASTASVSVGMLSDATAFQLQH